jgi:tetratricopeptide (TPR) repeat protein
VVFHLINSVLVFYFIYFLVRDTEIAFITGVLFGLHTLNVEVVAWVSGRKNLIYAIFYLSALVAYIRYVELDNVKYYIYSLLLFFLALLSKGQAVVLSLSIVLIDYLMRERLLIKRVIIEKIPFFILSLAFGLITLLAQKHTGYLAPSDLPVAGAPFYERIIYASYGFVQYILKLILPVNLSAIYPYPPKVDGHIPVELWFYLIPSTVVIGTGIYAVKKNKRLAFGILFFIANIFLMLKLMPVSYFLYADRYIYISSIALFFLIGIGYKAIPSNNYKLKNLLRLLLVIYLILLGALTYNRTQVWKNTISLLNDVLSKYSDLKKYPHMLGILNDRGLALADSGNLKAAMDDYNKIIQVDPTFYRAYISRGNAKKSMGDVHGAIKDYNKAIEVSPGQAFAFYNRGNIKYGLRDYKGAILDYDMAVRLKPDHMHSYYNRGNAKYSLGDHNGAVLDYNKTINLNPDYVEAYLNIGVNYGMLGDHEKEKEAYKKALKLKPDYTEAHFNLGMTYLNLQDRNSALKHSKILRTLDPKMADKLFNIINK